MTHSKWVAGFCVLLAAACMAGCSGLTRSDKPADTVWWLEPYAGMTPAGVDDPPMPA